MKKIVVAITGASGAIYANILLQKLAAMPSLQVAVVLSRNAHTVWQHELRNTTFELYHFKQYDVHDFNAPFASGSAAYDGLIICPCSMGTLGRIAAGISDNLITRCADVMLKERKKLIAVVRETPYSSIHLNAMKMITDAGGIICPASPSFYSLPTTFEELASTVVDRALALCGITINSFKWGEK